MTAPCPTCGTPLADTWTWCQNCTPAGDGAPAVALRPLKGLATAIYGAVAVAVLGRVLTTAVLGYQGYVVDTAWPGMSGLWLLTIVDTVSNIGLLVGLVCAIVWTHRARTNLDRIPDARPQRASWWAVGGWLIPFANLVMPAMTLTDIARNSPPAEHSRARPVPPGLIVGWAVAFGLSFCRIQGLVSMPIPFYQRLFISSLAETVLLAVSGVLFVLIIRGITAAQAGRRP
ncbi:DUF4328 domain-containing protein [Longispora sp. K20-0274]|uniref:DUF4328 domain-containing protein n=1 Tax=Longispora sp. K20-0274 TaxID=3088255 RepID=UPI00399BA099